MTGGVVNFGGQKRVSQNFKRLRLSVHFKISPKVEAVKRYFLSLNHFEDENWPRVEFSIVFASSRVTLLSFKI